MTEDSVFIGLVSLIWIALAALYAFVPMFAMPGSAVVWGSGAAVFLVLAVIIAITERRMTQKPKRA
jgi:membrane protein implicated in regulation of membrane protease activity